MAFTTNYFPKRASSAVTDGKSGFINSTLFESDAGLLGQGTATPTAWYHAKAATAEYASFRIPSGTDPSSPNEGDLWYNGTNLYFKPSGALVDLLAGGTGGVTGPGISTQYELSNYTNTDGDTIGRSGIIANGGIITTGAWQGTEVAVAYGGTGATTPAGARTNLSVPEAPGSSTDNGVAVWSGSGGDTLLSRGVTIDASDNVVIPGNLTVNGTATYVNTSSFEATDSLLFFAKGNVADTIDIGYFGTYNDGTQRYSGIFRDAGDGKIKAFTGLTEEPTSTVNTAGVGYTAATLVLGRLEVDNVVINGNTVSTSDTNGNLNLTPDGTGYVVLGKDLSTDRWNSSDTNTLIGIEVVGAGNLAATDCTVIGYQAGNSLSGGNSCTLIGSQAGSGNSTGVENTIIGYQAAQSVGANNYNTVVGSQTCAIGIGEDNCVFGRSAGQNLGAQNAVFGRSAMGNGVGSKADNCAFGYRAGFALSTGSENTIMGSGAGVALTTGSDCVLIGKDAGKIITTASNVTIVGTEAAQNTAGTGITAFGYRAMFGGTASFVTAIGLQSFEFATGTSLSVGCGAQTGFSNTSGVENTYLGHQAGYYNRTGSNNTGIGRGALFGASTQSHSNNTAVGFKALNVVSTGSTSTAVGANAGLAHTTAGNCTYIGYNAGAAQSTQANTVLIGAQAGEAACNTNCIAIGASAMLLGAGVNNIAIGKSAMAGGAGGATGCVAIGGLALDGALTGDNIVAIGLQAGTNVSSGGNHVLVGYNTASSLTTGTGCVVVGYNLDVTAADATDEIHLGNATNQDSTVGKEVADDGTIDLRDACFGLVHIGIADGEYAIASIQPNGTVDLIANSANFVNSDTDTKYCLFDNGTTVRFRNRIGSAKKVIINYLTGV